MAVDFSAHMFKQMNQDLAFDKRDASHYWEAMNMELVNNGQTLSMKTTSGTEIELEFDNLHEDGSGVLDYFIMFENTTYQFVTSLPDPISPRIHYNQSILGMSTLRKDLYIIVQTEYGLNVIYRFDGNTIEIVYAGYLNMTIQNPLEILSNYENEEVQKLYWVDGVNWFRMLNVSRENADVIKQLPSDFIDVAVPATLLPPQITGQLTSGNMKAGRIQYGYSLYNRSGQQSLLSPMSTIYSIGNTDTTGGESNETMTISLRVEITDLDPEYDSIRVYSIYYSEVGNTQIVTTIIDEGLSTNSISFTDDGNLFVSESSLDHLISLSNSKYKAGTLNTKKNLLFLGDFAIEQFDLDFDARAYSYNIADNKAKIMLSDGTDIIEFQTNYPDSTTLEHDSVNFDPSIYRWAYNLIETGGTGPYVSYRHILEYIDGSTPSSASYLKRGEKYRIGIVFRDKYGRTAPVSWVADTIIPYEGTLDNKTGQLSGYKIQVTLNFAGMELARDLGAVGYSVVMVDRGYNDRDIIAQGIIGPSYKTLDQDGDPLYNEDVWRPYYISKDITQDLPGNIQTAYSNGRDFEQDTDSVLDRELLKTDRFCTVISPDVRFKADLDMSANFIDIVGTSYLAPGTNTIYEAWTVNNADYGYGKGHPNELKYYDNDNGNSPIFDLDTPLLPKFLAGSGPDNESSCDVYFTRINAPIVYHSYTGPHHVEQIALKEPTTLLAAGASSIIDGTYNYLNISNTIQWTGGGDNGGPGKYSIYAKTDDRLVLVFNDGDWHDGTSPWNKFINLSGFDFYDRFSPIVDVRRGLTNQYGGNSFEVRRRNTYIEISNYREFGEGGETIIDTTIGDIFIYNYNSMNISGQGVLRGSGWQVYESITIALESYIDPEKRYDNSRELANVLGTTAEYRKNKQDDWYGYLSAYHHLPNATIFVPKPYNFQKITNFDTSIISSEFKFNNEVIDSWTNFLPTETLQLNSKYGKITKLQEFNGELVAFQPRAIASLSILPKVQVQGSEGFNVELGTGGILDDYNYITTRSGSANKWSIVSVNDDVIYYDYYNKSISSLKSGSLSLKHNINNIINEYHIYNEDYLLNDNPLINQGVATGYDTNKKNVYISLLGSNPVTISYNLLAQGFVSLHSFYPTISVEYDGKYISTDKFNKLYKHIYNFNTSLNRTLYDNTFTSYITILSSKEPLIVKNFGNVEFDLTGNDVFNEYEAWNDYQTTGVIPLYDRRNIRNLYRKWRISLGREVNTRNVLVDSKLWVKLIYNPDRLTEAGKGTLISNITLNNVEIKYIK